MMQKPLIVIIGLFAFLFGCGRQPESPRAAAPAKDAQVIDYAHESGGIFYHGTFSLIGGQVGATWTIDDGHEKKSQEMSMTEQTFRSIWDSVKEISDFKAGAAKDPDQQLDPSVGHVVGVISSIGGKQNAQAYMIPSASASPAFRDWLSKIGYTGK
jgi:hypothetical protein